VAGLPSTIVDGEGMLYSRMIQPSGAHEETSEDAGDQVQRERRLSTLRARRSPPGHAREEDSGVLTTELGLSDVWAC